MLYNEKLEQFKDDVDRAVGKLFAKAFDKQSHPNDLFLILIHGHYDQDLIKNGAGLNPYVFGPGRDGLKHDNEYDFFKWFQGVYLLTGNPIKHREFLKTQKDWYLHQKIVTQMEFLVYLKLWESDFFLKTIYNLCRLIHGEPYNWNTVFGNSRKTLIEDDIKKKCRKIVPKFSELIEETYIRQIRNAAAHSQHWISGDFMNFFNHDPKAGLYLKSINYETWEVIFHKSLLLYNGLANFAREYENIYRERALHLHFGLDVKGINQRSKTKSNFIRLFDPSDINSRWIWYQTYSDYYIKKVHIISY